MKKVLLVDGHSIANRAFYGVPLLSNAQGIYTNAVYGFINILLKNVDLENPTHLAVAFDEKRPHSGIRCMRIIKEPARECRKSCGRRCR